MKNNLFAILVLVVAICVLEVNAAASAPELKNNPFDQPNLIVESAANSKGQAAVRWSGQLYATLVSGKDSLANVDGNLIGVGEVYKGYRLIRVGEGTATFGKEGVQITVVVGSDGDDDNED